MSLRKKPLLKNLWANKHNILLSATVLNTVYNTNLHGALAHLIPNQVRNMIVDNQGLAQMLLNVFEPKEVFHVNTKEQEEAASRPVTWTATSHS